MSKQQQEDIRLSGTSQQNIITRKNEQRPPNSTMIITESQISPPTTTDQYHHTETIWRVITDIISLIICKIDILLIELKLKILYYFLVAVVTVISHYIAVPFTRGFFCSDPMIKYPIKSDTIPAYAAIILSICVPIVWVIKSFISLTKNKH
jgi:hypothetical protein